MVSTAGRLELIWFFASWAFVGALWARFLDAGGIFALKMCDFSKSAAGPSFCLPESPAGIFLVIMGCRRLKRMIAVVTMTSRIKETAIKPGINHRRLSFELFTCFVSMAFGMAKNESVRDDCTSILFKALRIELNLLILYPNSIIVRARSWAGESLDGRSESGIT